jgi:hypothetical protein
MDRNSPFPNNNTKQYKLLNLLLHGVRVDPIRANLELNLPTVMARASELRRLGWPVRVAKDPHPRLKGQEWTVYYFDPPFLAWVELNPGVHPREFQTALGRGKFQEDTHRHA